MLGTLQKAGRVIDLFTVDRPEWGVSEAAARLELPKSSVHAVFQALASIGLLERERTGRYRLGWAFVAHARTVLSTTGYRPHALRAMRGLLCRVGETVQLATLSRGRVITIARLEAPRGVRRPADAPAPPPHTSAGGKVLLAANARYETATPRALARLTERTLTSPAELEDELTIVSTRGYAYDEGEGRPDVCCVAAPLRAAGSEVIAALSTSVVRPRFERRRPEYTRAIVDAAAEASNRLRRGSAHY